MIFHCNMEVKVYCFQRESVGWYFHAAKYISPAFQLAKAFLLHISKGDRLVGFNLLHPAFVFSRHEERYQHQMMLLMMRYTLKVLFNKALSWMVVLGLT
jgi:hypothetical protein